MKKNTIYLVVIIIILSQILYSSTNYAKETEELISINKVRLDSAVYKIILASDPTKSLTVDGGKTDNGTNVHIWNYLDVKQQQFRIEYDDEGFCEIIPLHSEKRLDVAGWGNESNVNQWEYNGGNDNQKWIIRKSEKGNYNIISKRQNLYLDAYQSKTENGTNIQVYESSGGSGQEFKIEKIDINKPIEDDDEPEPPIEEYKPENPIEEKEKPEKIVENGTYKIVMAQDNEQSITVDGGKNNNGANIHLWKYVNVAQQQFNLVCDDEGYYEIIPINSGKRIDLAGWGNEANVDQWENNGGNDNQKWIIKKNKNGNYNIISKRQNLYLDAYQSKIQNGTNIEGYERSGGEGQEFKLEKIENVSERTIEDGIYKIAMQSNKNIVVEAAGSNIDNDGRLQIWKDYNVRAQKVKIEYENGYYKIFMVHSGKCFTVKYRNISSGTEIIQYEWNNGENQKWIIRDNGNGCYGIMPLSDESLAINIAGNIENGSILKLYNNEKNISQKFSLMRTNIAVDINIEKYPNIADNLDQLVEKHPNWQFEILYTTIDFNTAVQSEYEYAGKRGNLVYTPSYKGDWIAPAPYVSGVWASASYKGIAYFMDARNFLNDKDIFQFVDLSNYESAGATLESIQYQVNGTFLQSYAEDFRSVCERVGINPYYALARLFQEQGIDGSATIYMNGGDGNLYFNPFNIGAEVGKDVETALARAKRDGWNTMAKGLEGGIRIIKSYYLDIQQNTLYLNKFDVNPASGGGFYNHQYMQNLSAAYSEASILRETYEESNILDNKIKFIIPVYENMPRIVSERPNGNITVLDNNIEVNCNDRVYVKTNDGSGTNVRTGAGTNYSIIRAVSDNTRGTRVSTGKYYGSGYWWDYVCFDDGTQGYVVTNFLRKIN